MKRGAWEFEIFMSTKGTQYIVTFLTMDTISSNHEHFAPVTM